MRVEKNKKITICGRDDLSLTVFVPTDCQYNCEFCTTKNLYKQECSLEKILEKLNKISLGIKRYDKNIKSICITGGEPLADLDVLNTIIFKSLPISHNIFINTRLPKTTIEQSLALINEHPPIKGISISIHSHDENKYIDEYLKNWHFIWCKPRINCVISDELNLEEMLKRTNNLGLTLNLRENYQNTTIENLRNINWITDKLNMDEWFVNYNGGCHVCNTLELINIKNGQRLNYHNGLPQTFINVGNINIYNDIIIYPDGTMSLDWK